MKDELLTVKEVLSELKIAKSTWADWRALGKAPMVHRLPNGQLRVRRSVLERWLENLESEAA
jgi:hypothetical protein